MTHDHGALFAEYSDKFLEMASEYGHLGEPEKYDATGASTGVCGDTVRFFIRAENGRVAEVRFALEGCMHTLACANAVIELVADASVEEAWDVNETTIIERLGGIPKDHEHCAQLAAGALYKTLAALEKNGRS